MFRIDAPGFSAAELFWAGGDGKVLPGWTSFACEPLRDGRACLVFPDSLAVPEGASAVLCRAVSGDGRTAEQVLDFPTEAALDFPAEMAADFPAGERTAGTVLRSPATFISRIKRLRFHGSMNARWDRTDFCWRGIR